MAVIGDGALTGGMAYEALNQISHLKPPNLVIILNDNGRSYAPTVGGVAEHLAQLRLDPRYERVKNEIDQRLKDLRPAHEAARRIKESLKQLLQPATMFDTLGIKYSGPVDGHDRKAIEDLLRRARRHRGPVVVHVATEKGHGYGPASSPGATSSGRPSSPRRSAIPTWWRSPRPWPPPPGSSTSLANFPTGSSTSASASSTP